MDRIVSGYQYVYGGQTDEDAVLSKCRNAISSLEKVDKEIDHDSNSGMSNFITIIFFPNCRVLCIKQAKLTAHFLLLFSFLYYCICFT